MDLHVLVQLIFLLVMNVFVLFSGLLLNSLVVFCYLKSSQLRKKICHFTIGLLSSFDLLTVATNTPVLILELTLWIYDEGSHYNVRLVARFMQVFVCFSGATLLLISIERYIGLYHPIFHHTKITKAFLVKLQFVLLFFFFIMFLMYLFQWFILVFTLFFFLFFVPFLYLNIKLHLMAKKYGRNNSSSLNDNGYFPRKNKLNSKSISTCLILVACFFTCCIPTYLAFIYWAIDKQKEWYILKIWMRTFFCINSTGNCLIIFWKNKALRVQALRILKNVTNTPN